MRSLLFVNGFRLIPQRQAVQAAARLLVCLLLATSLVGCFGQRDDDDTDTEPDDPSSPDGDTGNGGTDGGRAQDRLPMQQNFSSESLASGFDAPWNLMWGPDEVLWITERVGGNILRVDPENGENLTVMPVSGVYQDAGQDGLLGMAFAPDFLQGDGQNHLFVAYTYDAAEGGGDEVDRRTKIVRFTYDEGNGTIGEEMELLSNLSASVDHNSGRMLLHPDGNLYYTIGDQGNNQFSRYCMEIQAQRLPTQQEVEDENWSAYQGKVLRIALDGSVPDDNPMIEGARSHVYTYGHRNPQGIALGPDETVYVSEHMDKSDDEINRLEPGGNYGWPHVSGYADDSAYRYVNWSGADDCEELEFTNVEEPPQGVPVQNETDFEEDFVEPVATFFSVGDDYDFTDPACGSNAYICWPTVAPSSLVYYDDEAVPEWNNSLLMTTLKSGRLFVVPLSEDGTGTRGEPQEMFVSENRFRDLALGPNNTTLYIITDPGGSAQSLDGGATDQLWNRGALLRFRYDEA